MLSFEWENYGGNKMEFIKTFNMIIFILITAMYAYQMFYIVVALVGKHRDKKRLKSKNTPPRSLAEVTQHRYGVLISARNESSVIGQLIDTIKGQKYPSELVEGFVVADNCTDNTAQVASEHGAIVYRRFDKVRVGKGYALDYAFHKIAAEYGDSYFDGYFVFDADNLLDEHYIEEMNKVFDQGYRVITSYRNSKNFGTNWLSAGYGLWFLREAKYLNNPRMRLGTSCAISGTGFLLSSDYPRAGRLDSPSADRGYRVHRRQRFKGRDHRLLRNGCALRRAARGFRAILASAHAVVQGVLPDHSQIRQAPHLRHLPQRRQQFCLL